MIIPQDKPDAVIFDLDGTLYHLRHFVLHLCRSHLIGTFRFRNDNIVRREFKGKDYENVDAMYDAFFTRYAQCAGFRSRDAAQKWYFSFYIPQICRVLKKYHPARKDMIDTIQYLKKSNIPVAVYSDYPCTKERMEAIGLPCDVSKIPQDLLFGMDSFGAFKPSARPFRSIAKILNVPCEKVLVIGDRDDTDGEGARAAGMQFKLA
ncbi:MAG: HAD family hydrolase [Termitinemataceae bacterium]|nr:MAG: HAD family hydrolase [Termitinemataceae bacterium]